MRCYEKEDGFYLIINLITVTLVSGTLAQTLTSTKCSLSEYLMALVQVPIFSTPLFRLAPPLHLNEIAHLAFFSH